MSEVFNKFINCGTDISTVMAVDPNDSDLIKALHKEGLVQIQKEVRGKHRTYTRMQWVKPSEAASVVLSQFKTVRDNKEKAIEPKFFPLSDCSKSTTRSHSLKEVIKQYNKSGSKSTLQTFIKSNYFVSDGVTQTKDFYCRNGEYSEERQKLHDSIVSKIVEQSGKPKQGEKPICILLGGGSASGKSTIRRLMVQPDLDENDIKVGTVDSDDIKAELPEYQEFQKQDVNSAAFRTHQESADIVDEAIDTLIYEKRHFIYDGTMKNPRKYKRIIQNLKDAGYEIRVVGADIPLDEAIKRSEARARKEGRNVPRSIVEGSHRGFASAFSEIAELADEYELYDNSGEFPALIKDKTGVQDNKLWGRFVKKGKSYGGAK
jgi:predicted ABC-type ATPase